MAKFYTIEGLRLFAKEYAETCNEYPRDVHCCEKDMAEGHTKEFIDFLEEKENDRSETI